MSWFGSANVCDMEREKRKTMAFDNVLKSFESRRNTVLTTCPSAIFHINHNVNGVNEFIAFDETGTTIIAKETHWVN